MMRTALTTLGLALALMTGTASAHPVHHWRHDHRHVVHWRHGHRHVVPTGQASFYRRGHRYTASGERFNRWAMTAASWRYPLGTRVRVYDLRTHRAVVVRINDRGPNRRLRRRVIDLAFGAARRLGYTRRGLDPVRLAVVGHPKARRYHRAHHVRYRR